MNNKYNNKTAKKAGEGKYGHYDHSTAIVGKEKIKFHEIRSRETSPKSKVQSCGLRLRAAGLVIFAMVAVWAVLPANGAEAAN